MTHNSWFITDDSPALFHACNNNKQLSLIIFFSNFRTKFPGPDFGWKYRGWYIWLCHLVEGLVQIRLQHSDLNGLGEIPCLGHLVWVRQSGDLKSNVSPPIFSFWHQVLGTDTSSIIVWPGAFKVPKFECSLWPWDLNSSHSLGATLIKIQFQIFADFGEISGFRKIREMRTLYHNCQIFSPVEGLTRKIVAHSNIGVTRFECDTLNQKMSSP